MSVYRWKDGFSCKVKAEVAQSRIETIRHLNGGSIAPSQLVDDAKPENAPLHDAFEWNDKIAAAKHREDQARQIIRSIEIIGRSADGEKTREIAYVSIARPFEEGAAYTATREALAVQESREIVLAAALAGLKAWERRYGHLKELARVIEAIRKVG